jgi:hypothetical protein
MKVIVADDTIAPPSSKLYPAPDFYNINGADVDIDDVIQGGSGNGSAWAAFDLDDGLEIWTFNYDYDTQTPYEVAEETNLPILQAFNKNAASECIADAVQPPMAMCDCEGTEFYEIWNWADLAYLNVMMEEYNNASNPAQTEWAKYNMKAILMQNLGVPGEGNSGNGKNGGATGDIICPYGDPDTDPRTQGWYGYQNWDGTGLPFDPEEIYTGTLLVGGAGGCKAKKIETSADPEDYFYCWNSEG